MESDYFTVVFAKCYEDSPKVLMYEVPAHTNIEAGDCICVKSDEGTLHAHVFLTDLLNLNYSSDRDKLDRYLKITSSTLPLERITSIIKEFPVEYDDEEENEDE